MALAPGAVARAAAEQGMVPAVARPLFGAYLVPFEITSILPARRDRRRRRARQAEL